MSTGYDRVAQKMDDIHKNEIVGIDGHLDLARQMPQAQGKYARSTRNQDLNALRNRAAGAIHRVRTLETASKELTPATIEHFADAIQHSSLEDALKAMPSHARSGPAGVHVRAFFAPAGPLGHQLSPEDERALDDIMNGVAVGTEKMGSNAQGASHVEPHGKQVDGGIDSKGKPESALHNTKPTPGTRRPQLFRNASAQLRAAMDEAFRSSK